jgi:hypothetical protein
MRRLENGDARKSVVSKLVVAVLVATLLGCIGYVPGRQTYWDARVQEMCAKDGGVTIYERVRISKGDLDRRILPITKDGKIGVAPEQLAHPSAPVYARNKTAVLREGNPGVWRSEWEIVRRSDGKVVARWVAYSRSGGDIPSPAHDSRVTCPELSRISSDLHQLFIVEEHSK